MSLLLCSVLVGLLLIPITVIALQALSHHLSSTRNSGSVVSLPSIVQMVFYLGIPSLILFALVAALNSISIQHSFSTPSTTSAASTTAWLQPYYQQRLLWMTDFSQPDQYHILAIIAGLLSSGLGLVMVRHTQAAFRRALSLYLLVLSPLSVSISFIIASGVALVWLLGYTVILTMQYGYAITGP